MGAPIDKVYLGQWKERARQWHQFFRHPGTAYKLGSSPGTVDYDMEVCESLQRYAFRDHH